MHHSLAYHVTPPAQRPFVPTRTRSVGVRFELGQIAPEPVPPPSYRDPSDVAHLKTPRLLTRPCPDCGEPFTPRASNHVRCQSCGVKHRRAKSKERWATDRETVLAERAQRRRVA